MEMCAETVRIALVATWIVLLEMTDQYPQVFFELSVHCLYVHILSHATLSFIQCGRYLGVPNVICTWPAYTPFSNLSQLSS